MNGMYIVVVGLFLIGYLYGNNGSNVPLLLFQVHLPYLRLHPLLV